MYQNKIIRRKGIRLEEEEPLFFFFSSLIFFLQSQYNFLGTWVHFFITLFFFFHSTASVKGNCLDSVSNQ